MTLQTPDSKTVTQLLPEKIQLPLQGLYLGQQLARMAAQMQKALVLTNYLTDRNGVIARADEHHHFQVPPETRNASDWKLYQELMAQADVTISGGDYLKSVSAPGGHPQDVLYQFEPGGGFEQLGEWRLRSGYEKRSPDVAVVSRHLDFTLPHQVLSSGRRISIFTTDRMARSDRARALSVPGTVVIGSGEAGVDGNRMIDYLGHEMAYRVIMMATGPGVLRLLLEAKRLDLLYITEVQREIPFDDPSAVTMLLPDGKSVRDLTEFHMTHEYSQDRAVTADGSLVSQFFRRYDRMGISGPPG